jgi:hypothetical protein
MDNITLAVNETDAAGELISQYTKAYVRLSRQIKYSM